MSVGLPGFFAVVVMLAVAIFIIGLPIVLLIKMARRKEGK